MTLRTSSMSDAREKNDADANKQVVAADSDPLESSAGPSLILMSRTRRAPDRGAARHSSALSDERHSGGQARELRTT